MQPRLPCSSSALYAPQTSTDVADGHPRTGGCKRISRLSKNNWQQPEGISMWRRMCLCARWGSCRSRANIRTRTWRVRSDVRVMVEEYTSCVLAQAPAPAVSVWLAFPFACVHADGEWPRRFVFVTYHLDPVTRARCLVWCAPVFPQGSAQCRLRRVPRRKGQQRRSDGHPGLVGRERFRERCGARGGVSGLERRGRGYSSGQHAR